MEFYEIIEDDMPGMARANTYGPVEDMWFLSSVFLSAKQESWRLYPKRSGLHIDRGGKIWPDILDCGNSPPGFFVSERVVSSLENIGAQFGRITPLPIAEINSKGLLQKPAPSYFVIESLPGIRVDFETTGFPVDASGNPILEPRPKPWPLPYRYRLDSWNGSDLFGYERFWSKNPPSTNLLCTARVKELAEKEGWTNIRFRPVLTV